MFGLFSKKKNIKCPIDHGTRLWMENTFLWLAGQFGKENIFRKSMLMPTQEYFPIHYDGSKESLTKTAEIIAKQMEIDIAEIKLDIYENSTQKFNSDVGPGIWTQIDNGQKVSAGMYFKKDEQGKYEILIEKENLKYPENLVAVIAHEFAHIKILGENRLEFNDELLTDMVPIVFGLGIFQANSSFREHKSFESYGYRSIGYLQQTEWGYALALYAYYRNEKDPDWMKALSPNIKSDFKNSMDFIYANTDKVFIEEYKLE